jgi:non-canonical (house-cleaning) NTP pyrophosphatase
MLIPHTQIIISQLIIENGLDMSQAANTSGLSCDPHLGDKGGLIALLTGQRVTRPEYTMQVGVCYTLSNCYRIDPSPHTHILSPPPSI